MVKDKSKTNQTNHQPIAQRHAGVAGAAMTGVGGAGVERADVVCWTGDPARGEAPPTPAVPADAIEERVGDVGGAWAVS